MKHITTKSGFEFDLDENRLNDMETFDCIVALSDGDTTMVPRILTRLLSKEAKKALYDHVRLEDGRVPIDAVSAELSAIFEAMGKTEKK